MLKFTLLREIFDDVILAVCSVLLTIVERSTVELLIVVAGSISEPTIVEKFLVPPVAVALISKLLISIVLLT